MMKYKSYLKGIYRTPVDKKDRSGMLRLDKNEDPGGLPEDFVEKVFSGISGASVSSYPQVYQLYEKISKRLKLSEEHILVTAGSDAAIKTAFEVFVEPGDEVVFPDPTYAMFEVYGKLFRAKIKKVRYSTDLSLDVRKIYGNMSTKTKLITIPNPNSPTGTIIDRKDVVGILDRARKLGAAVLIDEAYYPFHNETVIDLIDDYENLIVTRTFSKAFRLASVRLGFAAAHPGTIDVLRKFKPLYEVNGFAVLLGCALLDNMHLMEKFVSGVGDGRAFVEKEMEKIGLKTYKSHANFILIKVGEERVMPLVEYMKKKDILISGGFKHEALKDCIRISLGFAEQMRIPVQKIKEFIKGETE